ncbi:hypothetical protein [Deinococcus sp. NW-56]|uniref:hypothetical protein n=1 Tax=Deinococcus sp. NW-56 TaxID=2080419 RepID=UPI000CF4C3A6|nr:hypothetical protein [Deinococcus sp. NW-56]
MPTPPAPAPTSLLHGVDWPTVLYALGMATLMSVLTILRARNQQRALGQPLPGWADLIPDTLIGGLVGAMAAAFVPELWAPLKTFGGMTLCAGVGGTLGPKLTDWIGSNGLDTALDYVASGADRLSKAVSKRRKGGGDDGSGDQAPPAG